MCDLERDRPYDVESKSFIRREASQQAYLDTFKPTSPRGVVSSSGRSKGDSIPGLAFPENFSRGSWVPLAHGGKRAVRPMGEGPSGFG